MRKGSEHSMAFEGLSDKLESAFKKLKSKGSLTESDVRDAMREVRLALLEADVNYKIVKDFLINEKVIITLTLVDDIETPHTEVEISRNFLKRKEIICTINGEDVYVGELETKLMHTIFPSLNISKPTFRQIIAHNIRYEDIRLNNTLDILNAFTKTEEYETLYLFLFGCDYDEGRKREESIANIKSE